MNSGFDHIVLAVTMLDGPVEKVGATGPNRSICFHDPDGNPVEVANVVADPRGR